MSIKINPKKQKRKEQTREEINKMENSKNNTTIKGIKRKHNFFKKLDKICCETSQEKWR